MDTLHAPTEGRVHGLEELYRAHFHGLAVQLYAYTGDLGTAHDLVQEAFCRAIPRWSKVPAYDDPLAWIRRVAFNLATSNWRRKRTALAFARRHRTEDVPEPSPDRVVVAAAPPAYARRRPCRRRGARDSRGPCAARPSSAGTPNRWRQAGA
jgi:DNA-directed RNA polymerase specialized sigma24 family protein